MVTIWNPADEAQDYRFTLFFEGGHYQLPVHLEARATHAFNISQIIQNQIPDPDGNLIPTAVHEGSAEITGAQAHNQTILVAVDAGTYNVRKATCSYYCISCDGEVLAYAVISPFNMAKGGTYQMSFSAQDNHGNQFYTSGTWSSSATNVATVSSINGGSNGQVTGMSLGNVTITATGSGAVYNSYYCAYDPRCPYSSSFQGSGPGNVGPYMVEPININSQGTIGPGSCPTGGSYPGFVKYVTNQVQYANGSADDQSGVSVSDVISIGSRHDLGNGTATGTNTTTGDGSFQDRYSVCSPACPGGHRGDGRSAESDFWELSLAPCK